MSLPRRAARRDLSEKPIIDTLRRLGFAVQPLSVRNVPDLLIAKAGRAALAECKTGNAELEPGQRDWIAAWPGPVYVLRTVEDAIALAQGWACQSS